VRGAVFANVTKGYALGIRPLSGHALKARFNVCINKSSHIILPRT
jgi:hypothetical protein